MDKFKKIYYSPTGYLHDKAAARKLHEKIPELTLDQIQRWLDRQPEYQIYKPKPKRVNFSH